MKFDEYRAKFKLAKYFDFASTHPLVVAFLGTPFLMPVHCFCNRLQ